MSTQLVDAAATTTTPSTTAKARSDPQKLSVCPFSGCHKVFKRADYLTRHLSTHSNNRPHLCERCGISFTRRDLLNKHTRSKAHQLGGNKHTVFINTGTDEFPSKSRNVNTNINTNINTNNDTNNSSNPMTPSGRFSNVSNSVEDPFGWLFGGDVDILEMDEREFDSYSTTPMATNGQDDANGSGGAGVGGTGAGGAAPAFEQTIYDFAFSDATFESIQEFLQTDVSIDSSTSMVLFSEDQLNVFLSQYWNDFNSMYPVIHRPTFDVNTIDGRQLNSIFILSLVTIGMVCSSIDDPEIREEYYRVSCVIQRQLRVNVLSLLDSIDYNLSFIPLKLLQSLLLTGIFHMSYGDQTQHTKFHVYHPVTANIFRELKLFVDLSEPVCDPVSFNYASWCQWIRFESLKRIALFAYALDVEASFILLRTPSISVFEIQLEMPYTDSVWLAPTTHEFLEEYAKLPRDFVQRTDKGDDGGYINTRYNINDENVMSNGGLLPNIRSEGRWPNLLWSLRRLLQFYREEDREYHYNCFSQFSRFILLHAALSLVRDLRTTNFGFSDLKSMVPSGNVNAMAAKIEHGLFRWRSYFQVNIAKSNEAISVDAPGDEYDHSFEPSALNVYDTSLIFWANITLHHIGLLGLYCNFGLIISYCSMSIDSQINHHHFIESPGRQRYNAIETIRNKHLAKSWANSKDGDHSLVQACLLLRSVLSDESMISKIPYLPSAIHLAALVCWSHQYILEGHNNSKEEHNQEQLADVSKSEGLKFISLILDKDDMVEGSTQGTIEESGGSQRRVSLICLLVYMGVTLNKVDKALNCGESLLLLAKRL